MITQPQTLYGVADSPVGLAAWLINHDEASYFDIADAFAGHPVGNLTRDEVLDNVTFYWLTNTGVSSGRLYWENTYDFFGAKGVNIPAAVSVFPKELYKAPRSWAERAYPKLIYFNEVDGGATSPPGRSRRCSAASWCGVPVTALAGHRRMACTPCPPSASPDRGREPRLISSHKEASS